MALGLYARMISFLTVDAGAGRPETRRLGPVTSSRSSAALLAKGGMSTPSTRRDRTPLHDACWSGDGRDRPVAARQGRQDRGAPPGGGSSLCNTPCLHESRVCGAAVDRQGADVGDRLPEWFDRLARRRQPGSHRKSPKLLLDMGRPRLKRAGRGPGQHTLDEAAWTGAAAHGQVLLSNAARTVNIRHPARGQISSMLDCRR